MASKNDGLKIESSGKSGSLSFGYNDVNKFKKDLQTKVIPFLNDENQKRLDQWIKTH